MAEVYALCPNCTHTVLIHGSDGCHAYKCECQRRRKT